MNLAHGVIPFIVLAERNRKVARKMDKNRRFERCHICQLAWMKNGILNASPNQELLAPRP